MKDSEFLETLAYGLYWSTKITTDEYRQLMSIAAYLRKIEDTAG